MPERYGEKDIKKRQRYALILGLVLIIFVIRWISNTLEERKNAASYAQALTCLQEQRFDDAVEILQPLAEKEYNYSEQLLSYARTNLIDEEDVDERIYEMSPIKDDYDGDLAEEILEFRKSVYKKRDAIYAKEKAKRRRELRESIKERIPYVGMSTEFINATYVGPCTEQSSKLYSKGTIHQSLEYKYIWKYKDRVYLIVTAEDGKVNNVNKYHGGDWTWEGDLPVFNTSRKSYSGSYYSNDNSVDADDHDLDMYYYDYEDDFENIEDAWDAFEDDEDAWEDY